MSNPRQSPSRSEHSDNRRESHDSRSKEGNRPNLRQTLTRIATLSLSTASNPHAHRDHPAVLDLLRQAVEITRPWLEDVRRELEYHGEPHTEPRPRQNQSRRPGTGREGLRGHLLEELPNLLPILLKFLMRNRGRKGDPKRLGMLRGLHDVLEGKIEEAVGEIERLERALARGEGSRRQRETREYEERMRVREQRGWRAGGLAESYYSGEDVGDGRRNDRGGESGDGRHRRRRRGGSRRRRSAASHEREESQWSRTEEQRRSHANDRRAASNAGDSAEHRRRSHAASHPQRHSPRAINPRNLDFLTPSEREEARKRALDRYKELKTQTRTQPTPTIVPTSAQPEGSGSRATAVAPSEATTATRTSGSTESISRFPPPPIGVHASGAGGQDGEFWRMVGRGDVEWEYRRRLQSGVGEGEGGRSG